MMNCQVICTKVSVHVARWESKATFRQIRFNSLTAQRVVHSDAVLRNSPARHRLLPLPPLTSVFASGFQDAEWSLTLNSIEAPN